MKSVPSNLLSEFQSGCTASCYCLQITRADGEIFRFTSLDKDLTVSGNTYEAGLNVTSIAQAAGLAVNNLEVTILYNGTFQRVDFLAGRWDNARWYLFETNWKSTSDGQLVIGYYVTGEVRPGETSVTIEIRGLSQFLQQPIGFVTSKTCRARFADYPTPVNGNLCRISPSSYLTSGSITSVTSQYVARDSARGEDADWFTEGYLEFTSGDNAGLAQKVKDYDANGTFTFSLPFPFAIQAGDTYQAIAGCRKRRNLDCRTKFDNILNFQGEPDLPGPDRATEQPTIDAV